jgi:hypothetical protein
MKKNLISLLFHEDALGKERISQLEQLAECVDGIKRIDE